MIEWQNDWATYMPAKELKKVDMFITHGSVGQRLIQRQIHACVECCTIIQKSIDGCQRRFACAGIIMKSISI